MKRSNFKIYKSVIMDQKFEYIKRKTYYIVHLSTIGEKENTRGSKTFYNKKENNLLQLLKHFTAVLVIFWIDLKGKAYIKLATIENFSIN